MDTKTVRTSRLGAVELHGSLAPQNLKTLKHYFNAVTSDIVFFCIAGFPPGRFSRPTLLRVWSEIVVDLGSIVFH